jgi:PASTA domain
MIRFAILLTRGVVAAFTGLLIAGGTLTIAADRVAPQRPTLVPVAVSPKTLVVPQVTGQAYVFAKGILQDGGFAWRVSGPVRGYAGNTVADQQPAAGSVVVDTGAPTITLTLARNKGFAERGGPDNSAPYAGTRVLLPASSAAASTARARPSSVRIR